MPLGVMSKPCTCCRSWEKKKHWCSHEFCLKPCRKQAEQMLNSERVTQVIPSNWVESNQNENEEGQQENLENQEEQAEQVEQQEVGNGENQPVEDEPMKEESQKEEQVEMEEIPEQAQENLDIEMKPEEPDNAIES